MNESGILPFLIERKKWKTHDTSYLSNPDILIRKSIRRSKNLRIHLKFRSGGILENLIYRSGQKLDQEIITRNIYE